MAFSAGVYTLPTPALVPGQTVASTENNTFRNDVATAFNLTMLRNGTSTATANLPMGGYKLTGLGVATTSGDALSYGQAAVVSDITATGSVTVNSGTANGVAYLNGSKVLTTGSALTFDGSNLGLGVTPSAWFSSFKGLQLQGGALVTQGNGATFLTQNAYFNASAQWIYSASAPATYYSQNTSGQHVWFTAPSGTAGNAISFTQAMTLDASGNLQVNGGALQTYRPSVNHYGSIYMDSAAWNFNSNENYPIIFRTGTSGVSERMRIDPSGNVGIGTSSPSASAKLTIQDPTIAYFRAQNNVGGFLTMGCTDSASSWGKFNCTNNMLFQTNSTDRMLIDSSGNVGIGTSSPGFRLDVAGNIYLNANSTGLLFKDSGGNARSGLLLNSSNFYIHGSYTAGHAFQVYDSEAMRIDSSGNLLVGTTSAPAKLVVYTGFGGQVANFGDGAIDSSNYGVVQVTRPATNDTRHAYAFIRNGNAIGGIGFAQSSNTLVIVNGPNNAGNGMTLAPGGTSWGTQSDIRKKNVLGHIEDALTKIAGLQTVYFEYKNDPRKTRRVGFIAQEFLEILPEAVHIEENEEATLNLQYSDVIPLLTKAIQELKAELDATKAEVAALKQGA